jgi:hypothetical protein
MKTLTPSASLKVRVVRFSLPITMYFGVIRSTLAFLPELVYKMRTHIRYHYPRDHSNRGGDSKTN